MSGEIDLLARAHALFAHPADPPALTSAADDIRPLAATGALSAAYREAAAAHQVQGAEAARSDAALVRILDDARRDHADGGRGTSAVLAAARADSAVADNPIAARELLQRRITRLRHQRRHVLSARRRARRRRAALLALRYGLGPHPGRRRNARAEAAVRAALTRLGCPYVWGAAGPNRFDCSGLVTWAYGQAGVPVRRTTYEQIIDGVAVPRTQVRPGDLVFPHTGHVQLAIGNNLVIEAPYSGASVRISPLGPAVAIRRPL